MPRFWIDLASPSTLRRDEIGVEFETLDAAYLDVHHSIVEISAEMMREGQNPSQHRFEIRDGGGQLLLEAPFSEVLGTSRPMPRSSTVVILHEQLQDRLDRARALRAELRATLIQTRTTLEEARAVLNRSSAR